MKYKETFDSFEQKPLEKGPTIIPKLEIVCPTCSNVIKLVIQPEYVDYEVVAKRYKELWHRALIEIGQLQVQLNPKGPGLK